MHLGAHKILVVGVGQPRALGPGRATAARRERADHWAASPATRWPASFHDTLQADVEQTQRVDAHPAAAAARGGRRCCPTAASRCWPSQPTQSLDALAQAHAHELPAAVRRALGGLGALKGSGGALASYLLFEPGFVQALVALGEQDAYARKEELLELILGT